MHRQFSGVSQSYLLYNKQVYLAEMVISGRIKFIWNYKTKFDALLTISHYLKQNEAQSAGAESTHKGVELRLKDVTQTQQQRPESPR